MALAFFSAYFDSKGYSNYYNVMLKEKSVILKTFASNWAIASQNSFSVQLLFSVLIALIVTREYTYGTIQMSLIAVPKRLKFFISKIATGIILITIIYGVILIISFFISYWTFPNNQNKLSYATYLKPSIIDSITTDFLSNFILTLLSMIFIAIIICSISFIVKNSVGAIIIIICINIFIPLALININLNNRIISFITDTLKNYWPANLANYQHFSPYKSVLILFAETIIISVICYKIFKKQDIGDQQM
jgi:ABC-type transport system involved in multi-copper enzyme maturation permease subunit